MTGARRIPIGEASIHVRIDGPEGVPWLTCLHALATDLHLWNSLIPALTARYRVLRIDLRGHGGSSVGTTPYTIEGLARDVAAVWDALGVARTAVLGLSIGGMIGISLALDAPDRVSALIAADCRADAPAPFRATFDAREAALAAQGMAGIEAITLPSWLSEETRGARPDLVAALGATIRATPPDGYRAATAALRGLALLPSLPDLTVPILYLVGALDGAHPAAMREMAAATPGARLTEIAGAAHLSHLDRPAAFLAATLSFLESVS